MKAVLFDFWGTLIENGIFPSPVKQVKYILRINRPFSEYIVKFEDVFMTSKFENLTKGFENVIEEFGLNPPSFVLDRLVGMWNKNTILAKPFSDTIDTLKELRKKGIKLGIISNTSPFSADQVLDKFNLREFFDEITLSYKEGMLKSDAKLYATSLKRLGVDKKDAIMIGDSIESDMKSAANAGVRAYLIDRKDRRDYENKITSLKEILDME